MQRADVDLGGVIATWKLNLDHNGYKSSYSTDTAFLQRLGLTRAWFLCTFLVQLGGFPFVGTR